MLTTPETIMDKLAVELQIDRLNKEFSIGNEELSYKSPDLSIQVLADAVNPYYGTIGNTEVGLPLLVHRRCIDPMFTISNQISYDNQMLKETYDKEGDYVIESSGFIDVKNGSSKGSKNHYIEEEGEEVIGIINQSISRNIDPFQGDNLYIISPFTSVVSGISNHIKRTYKDSPDKGKIRKWLTTNVGTVHRFQGKEADSVIFLLGCKSGENGIPGAAKWANKKPNILNVAATRAKYKFLMIGEKTLWNQLDNFSVAIKELEK